MKTNFQEYIRCVFFHILDNAAYYAQGVVDGMQQTLDNLEVSYTYHLHEGDGTSAIGCYIAVYHEHASGCYTTINYRYDTVADSGGVYAQCPNCGNKQMVAADGDKCYKGCTYKSLTCGKAPTTIEKYILGCGKTEETIESVTITY